MAQHQAYNLSSGLTADQTATLERQRRAIHQRLMRQPDNLNLAFGYANLSAKLGDFEGAAGTYEAMLMRVDVPRIRLDLAATYYRLGAMGPARAHFEKVRATPDLPPPVLARIQSYLQAIERQDTAQKRFSGRISFGARWQSNANTSPDGAVSVPSCNCDLQFSGESDASALLSGHLRWRVPFAPAGHAFEVSLASGMSEFADLGSLSNRTLEMRLGPDFALPSFAGIQRARLALSLSFGRSWLGGTSYMHNTGLLAQLRMPLDRKNNLAVSLEWREEDMQISSLRPRAKDHSGERTRLGLTWTRQMSQKLQIVTSLSQEWRRAQREFHSHNETQLRLAANLRHKPLIGTGAQPWLTSASLTMGWRDNLAPNPGIDPRQAQSGTELNVQLTESIPLAKDLGLQLVTGLRRVQSNYKLREFNDHYIGFTLSHSF